MNSAVSFALGAVAGAAAAHLLDPENGAARRGRLREQVNARTRRGASAVQAQAQEAAGTVQEQARQAAGTIQEQAQEAAGTVQEQARQAAGAAPAGEPRLADPDDQTLARRVETEIFRDADAPKGGVSVDVQAGVAYLRGEAPPEWVARFGDRAAAVEGISRVENLLHPSGTPAPAAAPRGYVEERLQS